MARMRAGSDEGCIASLRMIAAEQGGACAPSAGGDDLLVLLDDQISAVFNQLAVETHDGERRRHLVGRQIGRKQLCDGCLHQQLQLRCIAGVGVPPRVAGIEGHRRPQA
jgi:hypothetical protein